MDPKNLVSHKDWRTLKIPKVVGGFKKPRILEENFQRIWSNKEYYIGKEEDSGKIGVEKIISWIFKEVGEPKNMIP